MMNDSHEVWTGYKTAPADTLPLCKVAMTSDRIHVKNASCDEFLVKDSSSMFNTNHISMSNDGSILVFEYQATPTTHPNPEVRLTVKSDGVYVVNANSIEFKIQSTGFSSLENEIQEIKDYNEINPLPESHIVGPESGIECGAQNIRYEIHNLPQPPDRCSGIITILNLNSIWAFYLEHETGDVDE
jgi:hypothetical protein